jgi:hypothetical protein
LEGGKYCHSARTFSTKNAKPSGEQLVDAVRSGNDPNDKKVKIRICGHDIWKHERRETMARASWLHSSIMAKDCSFQHAMCLCRNWNESPSMPG